MKSYACHAPYHDTRLKTTIQSSTSLRQIPPQNIFFVPTKLCIKGLRTINEYLYLYLYLYISPTRPQSNDRRTRRLFAAIDSSQLRGRGCLQLSQTLTAFRSPSLVPHKMTIMFVFVQVLYYRNADKSLLRQPSPPTVLFCQKMKRNQALSLSFVHVCMCVPCLEVSVGAHWHALQDTSMVALPCRACPYPSPTERTQAFADRADNPIHPPFLGFPQSWHALAACIS